MSKRARRGGTAKSIKLKPADPFELIRWLAQSQSDPRKAIAELVQNSLDAAAKTITIERVRIRKQVTMRIRDDGEGVLPQLGREEALTHLATHVGHSHKLGLDPAERHRRVIAGQYGVGLLGFWSVGALLELRSRVNGSEVWVLRMEQDSPRAQVEQVAVRTDAPPTFTEVVVGPLHSNAQKALSGRKLSDYLASELRGQILQSGAELMVHDRIARGAAQKQFLVTPRRFSGERLALPERVAVEGFASMRVEIYAARGAERPTIQLACAGTAVSDDITTVAVLGLDRAPWTGHDLTGVIDFADFAIPPGSRRGVQPNAAAEAFARAARGELEPLIVDQLGQLEDERRAAADRDVVRELRRALRGLRTLLPQYELPTVTGKGNTPAPEGDGDAAQRIVVEPEDVEPDEMPLFPPGPLASVRIVPTRIRVSPGSERFVKAHAVDTNGRAIDDVTFEWRMPDGPAAGVSLHGDGERPLLVTAPHATLGTQVPLMVVATQGEAFESAMAAIVVAPRPLGGESGIPEPHLVSEPERSWRSRMRGDFWEVNEAHPDYVGVRDDHKVRLRYLLALLAKEIVLRTTGRHEAADVLESLVEVLAHAERNLRGR